MHSDYTSSLSNNLHRQHKKTVKVTGESTLQATPDQAIITLGVHTENVDLKIAQQENSKAITQIITALRSLGIAIENIKTSEYRIDPQYHYVDGKEIFQNYKVQHMIQVKTKDIETVGSIVDTAITKGANSVSSVRFSLSNSNVYYNQALTLALNNAYEKAQTLTKNLETPLNPLPILIEELSSPISPILYQTSALPKAGSTAIMPGELQITATVRVEYTY